MTVTITAQTSVVRSDSLGRDLIQPNLKGYWSTPGELQRDDMIGPGQTIHLDPCQVVIIGADPAASVVLGWVVSGVTTEIAVSLLAVITPPVGVAPYIRSTLATGVSPTPVTTVVVH